MTTEQPTEPQPIAPTSKTYLLAADSQGRQIVSVHVKRTYRLHPDGRCTRAEGEIPLMLGNPDAEDAADFSEGDIVPFKQRTDLVVMAKAWGMGARQILAKIRMAEREVTYRVSGDRKVRYQGPGSWRFTEPEPFEAIEMRYENAYGGFDDTVPPPKIAHIDDMLSLDPAAYPRNPVGKGYAVFDSRERLEGLPLPNIENPADPITPQRLVSGHPDSWWRQPLPWSCNWFPPFWYPRLVYYGGLPGGLPLDDRQVPEVQQGYLDAGHARHVVNAPLDALLDGRFADAASPALIWPLLRRVDPIELTGLSPHGRMLVQIPQDHPRIFLRHKGKLEELKVTPHRILISLLEMGAYVVWHAAWYPPEGLFDGLSESEDPTEKLHSHVEVFSDQEKLSPLV